MPLHQTKSTGENKSGEALPNVSGYQPLLELAMLISKVEGFWNLIILEAICIQNESLTVNKDTGLGLDSSWTLILWLLSCQCYLVFKWIILIAFNFMGR